MSWYGGPGEVSKRGNDSLARNRTSFPHTVLLRCTLVSQLWRDAGRASRESSDYPSTLSIMSGQRLRFFSVSERTVQSVPCHSGNKKSRPRGGEKNHWAASRAFDVRVDASSCELRW